MTVERNRATKEHIDAVIRICTHFTNQIEMADFLGITTNCISNWKSGRQVVPLRHAEALANLVPGETVLTIRPDIKKYEKYFLQC